jgi:hypothetical protein
MFDSMTWNREELYEKVWSEPVTKVAKGYGVSDVALAKACRKLKVPVPGRGYWAKKEHGHRVERQSLPKLVEPVVVTRMIRPAVQSRKLHPDDEREFARIDKLLSSGAFARPVTPPALRHPLVLTLRKGLNEGNADDRHILRSGPDAIDVRVSKNNVSRVIEVVARLIATLEAQGATVTITESRWEKHTKIAAFGEHVSFSISESAHQVEITPPVQRPGKYVRLATFAGKPIDYVPTGNMTLEIATYGDNLRRRWNENKHKLDDLIPDIVATLLKAAVLKRRATLTRQAEELAARKRQEEIALLRQRIEEEEKRVKKLEAEALAWERARSLRQFVLAAIDVHKVAGEEVGPDAQLGIWAAWALQYADWLDPLVKSPRSILDGKRELASRAVGLSISERLHLSNEA